MKKRKLLVSLLVAGAALSLASCGGDDDDVTTITPSDSTTSAEPSDIPSEEPSEVPSEEPSDIPSDEPSEVPSEEPSEVPSDEPSEVDPSTPSVPSDEPSESEPEVPSESEPEVPSESEPEVPSESEPEVPSESEPEVPSESEPEVPSESEPEVPSESEPEVPSESEPEVPSESEPEVPSESEPEVPSESEPEVPSESEPEVPSESEPSVEVKTAKAYFYVSPNDETPEEVEFELDEEGWGFFNLLEAPKDDYRKFTGWYTDPEVQDNTTLVAGTEYENDGDIHLYAGWEGTKKSAEFEVKPEEFAVGKDGFVSSIFTVASGTEVRARSKKYTALDGTVIQFTQSIKMNGTSAKVTAVVPGDGDMIIYAQNGSSSATEQYINFKNVETGEEQTFGLYNESGAMDVSNVVKLTIPLTAGTWEFTQASGTVDYYNMYFSCELDNSPISGFEITDSGITQLIEGDDYDPTSIALNKVYENKTTEPLSLDYIEINADALDTTVPGTYNVELTYSVTEWIYGEQVSTDHKLEVPVTVYDVQDITLGFNATVKASKNNKWGNGVYINETVQRVYVDGQTFDPSNLTVTVNAKDVTTGELVDFIVNSNYVLDNETSFAAEGVAKTISVTYSKNGSEFVKTFDVYVVAAAPSVDENGVVQIAVDQMYPGEIGAVVNGANMFNTIQQAMDYLEIYNDADIANSINGKKIQLNLASGIYREKIEVKVPNLTITGASPRLTTIEWDSLYGIEDESGYLQVTDSTATLAVRDTAENFKIEGVTISNYWNNYSVFDDAFGYNYGEHRALAMLIQADKVVVDNCMLLGYQDTLELMSGRQVISNSYIAGTTDFIFGTNNTTYFNNCTIHSIDTGKADVADDGTATLKETTDGGYITAFKGENGGKNIKYGAIFDGCQFTADAITTASQNTSIARPWGAYSAVVVMNSELGGHISKKGFETDIKKNLRYVGGLASGVWPTTETVQFFEYNNTGEGAITEEVAGMKFLTDEQAAEYATMLTIFNHTNGTMTYDDIWGYEVATDAVVNVISGETTLSTLNGYVGTTLTEKQIDAIIDSIEVPSGKKLVGLFTDAEGVTEFDTTTELTAETNVYVIYESAGNTGTVVYDEITATVDGWTVNMATAGSSKIANTVGDPCNDDTVPYTSCDKLVAGTDYLLSPTFTAVNNATIEIIGGTTSTGNAVDILVEALDADGNVVSTATGSGPTGKLTGYVTDASGNKALTISSETQFVQVRISTTTDGKNFCVLSTTVEYVLPAQEHTYNFSLEELVAAYGETAPADKTNIEAQHLTGANSFLTLAGEASNKCVVRAGNNCIEIKDAQLNVTFQGTGTITVSFASTGGSNTSYFALLDSDGNPLVATETNAALVTGETAIYQVTGTTYLTNTYTITEAGTYSISCPSTPGRGGRVNAITMVDNF